MNESKSALFIRKMNKEWYLKCGSKESSHTLGKFTTFWIFFFFFKFKWVNFLNDYFRIDFELNIELDGFQALFNVWMNNWNLLHNYQKFGFPILREGFKKKGDKLSK